MAKEETFKKPSRRKACFFEANNLEPSFSDTAVLRRFLTERGKIVAASRSGVCSKHQRRLSREIKKSRQLGFLPFIER